MPRTPEGFKLYTGRGRRPICRDGGPVGPDGYCLRCGGVKREEPVTTAAPEPTPEDAEAPIEALAEAVVEALEPAPGWTPDERDFVNIKGSAYLPARRRVQWMRGLPVAHPDWTIDTEVVEHDRGKLTRPGPVGVAKVDGGYALVRANVFDVEGRLIATGCKSEYSENFPDYLEKAETGAIARALAIAGYGTESALDLDEGIEAGRIADAPVAAPVGGPGRSGLAQRAPLMDLATPHERDSRPITISAPTHAAVGRGAMPSFSTGVQVKKIGELSSALGLGVSGLAGVIDEVLGTDLIHIVEGDAAMADWIKAQSATDVGRIIIALETAKDVRREAPRA